MSLFYVLFVLDDGDREVFEQQRGKKQDLYIVLMFIVASRDLGMSCVLVLKLETEFVSFVLMKCALETVSIYFRDLHPKHTTSMSLLHVWAC